MAKLYYTPPTDLAFDDMKFCAIWVWGRMDDTYGYATEKISQIKDIANVGDNFMYIFAMFDIINQKSVVDLLQEPTKDALRERMVDGGNHEYEIMGIGL